MPTIAAIATPPGRGGIGIVRISGPGAKNLLSRVFLPRSPRFVNFRPWTMHRGVVLNTDDEPLDDVLAVYMPGPRTYTGEDMAEIQCHGGAFLLNSVLDSLLRLGARLAEPGEFTRRAFINGRMDLSQAEAVAEMIAAPSADALRQGMERLEGRLANHARELKRKTDELRALARLGLDFPDDEIEGLNNNEFENQVSAIISIIQNLLKGARRARLMRDGGMIALAGPVNAGKSSLLNALSGRERALVTEMPGTTRDFIEENLSLDGLPVRLVDTAGLRQGTEDPIEALGMAKSREILATADLIALVIDSSIDTTAVQSIYNDLPPKPLVLVWNKSDLAQPEFPDWAKARKNCRVSSLTGENIESLASLLRETLMEQSGPASEEAAPNTRQSAALEKARAELEELQADLASGQPYDCCLARLDVASQALGEIIGLAADTDLLDRIFSQFCIGK